MPSTITVETKGSRQVSILSTGQKKARATVMLCSTADGQKLPLHLVFKCNMLPKGAVFPSGIIMRINKKRWKNTGLVSNWVDNVWWKRPSDS